jgi:putative CocE/NonD family hydrolase
MSVAKLGNGSQIVSMQWGVRIPMRDGIHLDATLYTPAGRDVPSPAIFTLTPYIAQTYHDIGLYFAEHGYPFLAVDVRGRGNSEGTFQPLVNEAADGYDVVEWIARQPYCNGKVTMWGGSYGGFVQWATARDLPPHLATIVPVASPYAGVDFPMRNNIPYPYLLQWLTLVAGRTSQERMFWNKERFWGEKFRQWFESGTAFRYLDTFLGLPSATFQEWMDHPLLGGYWDRLNPTAEQYAQVSMRVLTITGSYDGDQPGALAHYREHLKNRPDHARSAHYLIIGPWDHAGTRDPQQRFSGLEAGPESLVDLRKLHLEWYAWTMEGGPKPQFLKKNVAYYVMGAEVWRYADSLEEVTASVMQLYVGSSGNPTDVFHSGFLAAQSLPQDGIDHYVYDPRDVAHGAIESTVDPESRVDQRVVHALVGRQLIYHSAPFPADTEISGFFRFSAWIAIDQPDTDFLVSVYDVQIDGTSVQLTSDWIRARHREGLYRESLIDTKQPLHYQFERFTFISRRISKGSRLRLVVGPINSIYSQKNCNSGGIVSDESAAESRPVRVSLLHGPNHPCVLDVPIGRSGDRNE